MPSAPRPSSVTNFVPSCLAYAAAGVVVVSCAWLQLPAVFTAFASLFTALAGLLLVELRHPSRDRLWGHDRQELPPRNWRRTGIKLLGLAITLSVLTAIYGLIPPALRSEFETFLTLWPIGLAAIAVAAPIIFVETDRRMTHPEDAYYQLGALALGQRRHAHPRDLVAHAMGWTVKGFFLPIMLGWFIKLTVVFTQMFTAGEPATIATLLLGAMLWMFLLDLMGGFLGYAMTFKILGTHIRSVNPMVIGWIAALICYPPFYDVIGSLTRHVEDLAWIDHIVAAPHFWPLAIGIISLQIIYTLATFGFGLRFSNLTNRGVVTGGMYRWVKHPAYLAKNSFWWLMSLPFLGTGPAAQWAMICIAGINLIYFVRAKTEERHLMADPAYRAYAAWIEDHGLFAPLTRGRVALARRFRTPHPAKTRRI